MCVLSLIKSMNTHHYIFLTFLLELSCLLYQLFLNFEGYFKKYFLPLILTEMLQLGQKEFHEVALFP